MIIGAQALPTQAFQTFMLSRPLSEQFWRAATCEQVECVRRRNGWRTVLDISTVEGLRQARWISDKSGRRGTVEQTGTVVTFTFQAGQNCFESHQLPIEREPLYVVRNGRVGAHYGQARRHVRGEDWRDHMQEELGKVADDRERG